MNNRGSAPGGALLASNPASSSRDERSNSYRNFSAALVAFPSDRQTANMMPQLRSDSATSRPSTICVSRVAFITSSTGLDGTAPRDTWSSIGMTFTARKERESGQRRRGGGTTRREPIVRIGESLLQRDA